MRKLYDTVNETLGNVNFNNLWEGFEKTGFALYDKKYVYFSDKVIPYDTRFLGNTTIEYEGRNLAIWFVENLEGVNSKELSANMVHEIFHSYQKSQKEARFPDDIKALSYPGNLENYELKYNENLMLVEALNSIDKSVKLDLLKKIVASRKFRLNKFGELIKYEFSIETIEGSAEYCGTKALKEISDDLYKSRIAGYKEIISADMKLLFDIRRSCYFTGALFLILLDEVEIDFSKEIKGEELTIFERISSKINTDNIEVELKDFEIVHRAFEEESKVKSKFLEEFLSNNLIEHEGDFRICGYDPMNMFKVEDKILCSHFIMLQSINTKENIFVPGPVLVICEDDSKAVKKYYTIRDRK